jgi:inorganic triphosphatase YgiF
MIRKEYDIIEIEEKFGIPKTAEVELRKRVLGLNWDALPKSTQKDVYMDTPCGTAMNERICVRIREED